MPSCRDCPPGSKRPIKAANRDPGDRFWSRVEPTGFCWYWRGIMDGARRYGLYRLDSGRRRVAHRVAYEALVGPIPPGLTIDHVCRTPSCVNPDHLEPVTQGENNRRIPPGARNHPNARKTHCPQGHAEWKVNKRGDRACLACKREQQRAWKEGKRHA